MSKSIIKTRDFEEVEIDTEAVLKFSDGLFAFENSKNFALLSPLGEGDYPMWLQSTEDENLCFIVFSPYAVMEEYKPTITEEMKKMIELDNEDDLRFLVIAVVPENFKKSTVNLKSPIIVNNKKGTAAQVILEDDYQLRFPIFTDRGDR